MYLRKALVLVVLLFSSAANAATPLLDDQISGLSFGDTHEQALAALSTSCANIRSVVIDPPSFPLARESERHLICEDYALGEQHIEQMALTFADDELVLLYAKGNAALPLLNMAGAPLAKYLHFDVSFKLLLITDKAADEAWVLSPDAAHPSLFQWPNPFVSVGADRAPDYLSSAKVPSVLKFGQKLEDLKPLFEVSCTFMSLRETDVWLLNKPKLQQQIDCFGYQFAGYPRKIEAVFGDGILEQAWILTGKGEEGRVRKALIDAYGAPIHQTDSWDVFDNNRVMLRKDKPEVLMLSDKLAPLYRNQIID